MRKAYLTHIVCALNCVVLIEALPCGGEEQANVSGGGSLAISRSDSIGEGEGLSVHVVDSKTGANVAGRVKVSGVPIPQQIDLRKVEWNLSGSAVSGTVNADAGQVMAWFKGAVGDGKLKGTFTTVTGQSGNWEWEGPVPDTGGK